MFFSHEKIISERPGMYRDCEEWESYLGDQLRKMRLRLNISQLEAAERLGINPNTVARCERGDGSSLSTFIKLLQLYNKDQWLETIAPQASISPIQQFELGHQRKRAGKAR